MKKFDYKTRACHFFEILYPYIKDFIDNPYYCYQAIKKFNEEKHRKVDVNWGSVRIAIMTSDYVIKYDYDHEDAKNYGGCKDEEKFYKFAKEKGFEYLFAEITSFEYMGRTFYIMPRVSHVNQEEARAEDFLEGEDYNFVKKYVYDLHNENFGWKNNYPFIFDYAYNIFMEKK